MLSGCYLDAIWMLSGCYLTYLSLTSAVLFDDVWVCLKIVYPIVPNGFADHYPYEKWLFHWEYTQHFQTNLFDGWFPWFPQDPTHQKRPSTG